MGYPGSSKLRPPKSSRCWKRFLKFPYLSKDQTLERIMQLPLPLLSLSWTNLGSAGESRNTLLRFVHESCLCLAHLVPGTFYDLSPRAAHLPRTVYCPSQFRLQFCPLHHEEVGISAWITLGYGGATLCDGSPCTARGFVKPSCLLQQSCSGCSFYFTLTSSNLRSS